MARSSSTVYLYGSSPGLKPLYRLQSREEGNGAERDRGLGANRKGKVTITPYHSRNTATDKQRN
eukprot:1605104-Rhodomonas_salina.2